MLIIFWNPNGFLLVDALDDDRVYNADYFINEILGEIISRTEYDGEISNKKLMLHFDNARPHNAKKVTPFLDQNGINIAPHPPYSPDIPPSDFFLFGYIKNRLQEFDFDCVEDLLFQVQ